MPERSSLGRNFRLQVSEVYIPRTGDPTSIVRMTKHEWRADHKINQKAEKEARLNWV